MQPDDALSDAALDRELARACAVDPSPEFVARVRTRIVEEPMRSWTRNLSWSLAAGIAAAIVVAAVAIQLATQRTKSTVTAPLLAARPLSPPTGVWLGSAAEAVATHRPAEAVSAHRLRGLARQPDRSRQVLQSEVLFDRRETAALRRLIDGIRSGRVSLDPIIGGSVTTPMDLPPVDAIVIPPITIEPLAPISAQGVRP
jgi:hypothetical protein